MSKVREISIRPTRGHLFLVKLTIECAGQDRTGPVIGVQCTLVSTENEPVFLVSRVVSVAVKGFVIWSAFLLFWLPPG